MTKDSRYAPGDVLSPRVSWSVGVYSGIKSNPIATNIWSLQRITNQLDELDMAIIVAKERTDNSWSDSATLVIMPNYVGWIWLHVTQDNKETNG